MKDQRGIILFDGVCNLCNKGVDFIIKRDQNKYYYFCSIQSEKGQKLMETYAIGDVDSMIVIENDQAYTHSDAVLKIVRKLPLRWRVLLLAYVIPRSWREKLYQLIAKHRYRFFGKASACRLPTAEERAQFL
ncbi:thiol-disulfide oxidoreductase DCC family protein [Alkalicoccobacillus murimartini]|uniref:DCC family thiol-disulfide oxidoreductase YuxK n=1 Tax=Alkalicoccobacillus murimartini TaxID=171685 RepID=A0ABT9YKC6_9BACI|nr:DCC1-like thiol-disulfide oxidoreductase family protein [Alkalicoccobacillus murimartini]MDQ0208323.1 putative DCC family thiol-disulfide oxidoreductase YuxK [Alkalicoccobacillus murimartini]